MHHNKPPTTVLSLYDGDACTWETVFILQQAMDASSHDDVIKWKHFPRYWPFVWGIHRSSVNSLHKGQWRGALMFSLTCPWTNGWGNNREAGDLRRNRAHYDVIVMQRSIMGQRLLRQDTGEDVVVISHELSIPCGGPWENGISYGRLTQRNKATDHEGKGLPIENHHIYDDFRLVARFLHGQWLCFFGRV